MSKHNPCRCLTVVGSELKTAQCDSTGSQTGNQQWTEQSVDLWKYGVDGTLCVVLSTEGEEDEGWAEVKKCRTGRQFLTQPGLVRTPWGYVAEGAFQASGTKLWLTIDHDLNLVFLPRMSVSDTGPQEWAKYPKAGGPSCSSSDTHLKTTDCGSASHDLQSCNAQEGCIWSALNVTAESMEGSGECNNVVV